MMRRMKRYSIWAPHYHQNSGGVRALYQLNDRLQALGFDTEIGRRRKFQDSVVIYPEIIPDNPWKARRAVRWALRATVVTRPEDQVWSWSVSFLDVLNILTGRGLTESDVFQLPLTETEIFNNNHPSPRKGIIFFKAPQMRENNWMTEITMSWPSTRQEMAALLRRSEYLICGKMSNMIDEARFCGCPVLITGWEKPIRTDYGLDGICWSLNELDEARKTVNDALPKYLDYHKKLPERLVYFIKHTQETV
jgi:hypothetical protein